MPQLISRLERATDDGALAWPDIAKTFFTIAQNKFNEIPAVKPGTWTGKLKFETMDGQKIVIKDGCLCAVTDGEATVFNVLDADLKRRTEANPQMPLVCRERLWIVGTWCCRLERWLTENTAICGPSTFLDPKP